MGAETVAAILAGSTANQTAVSGAQTNLVSNEEYSIANAYHHDHEEGSLTGQSPTSFNGQTLRFQLEKFSDCFKEAYFEIITNPVAGVTTEAFVNYYGYWVVPTMFMKLTNNNYTPNNEVAYYKFDVDRTRYNSRQYIGYKQEDHLAGVPLAVRQAALANGHTCYCDLQVGGAKHGLENFFWMSTLAHELTVHCKLAQASDVIYDPANNGGLITAGLANIIQAIRFKHVAVTVDEDARAVEVSKANSDAGIYNYIQQPIYWTFNIPSTHTGIYEFQLREVRAFSMMTIFYECEDKTQAWQREPFDIQGPSMTDLAGNTVNFPTYFYLKGGSGKTEIVRERSVDIHRRWEHAHRFVDREPNDWILNVSHALIDPLKDNTAQNSIHPDVYNHITLGFRWDGAPFVGAGAGARVTVLLHCHNFINNANSDACVLIC